MADKEEEKYPTCLKHLGPNDRERRLLGRWNIPKEGENEMLKPGDKVVMNDRYHVSEANKGKIWTVMAEPWNCCGTMVVKLEGKSGGYAVDGLDKVEE